MRKNKRLLSVHPMDFDSEDYLPHSRRPSVQIIHTLALSLESRPAFIDSLNIKLNQFWFLCFLTRCENQMQDDRCYRNDMDYDYYNHRANRRKSLDRYTMRPGQSTQTKTTNTHIVCIHLLYLYHLPAWVHMCLCSTHASTGFFHLFGFSQRTMQRAGWSGPALCLRSVPQWPGSSMLTPQMRMSTPGTPSCTNNLPIAGRTAELPHRKTWAKPPR